MRILGALLIALAAACAREAKAPAPQCALSLVVLGVAQDGGKPQLGNPDDPSWTDQSQRRFATSLALIDRREGKVKRFLFEATPDLREQLHRLDLIAPVPNSVALDGIFLTHAHIGHYAGLMFLGHESAGASYVPVYAMPHMADFLAKNGPWSQLVRKENIYLAIMSDGEGETVAPDVMVTPFAVPHRQEFSEVVGFRIDGPSKTIVFLPDIDSWEEWDKAGTRIEDVIAGADIALLDATFFANGEIPGRDMKGFPHPFVSHSMERFAPLPPAEKAKVRFIHLNHSNPLLDAQSKERKAVRDAGFGVAEEGETICL